MMPDPENGRAAEDTSAGRGEILIVEDSPASLHLLTQMLIESGYKVRPVTSGAQALAAARSRPPDLILLDIVMPEMDGYEVCQYLKADARTRDIPVIFLSALGTTGDKVKAFAVGGVDYVTKPFQVGEVMARVTLHLTLQHLQNQLQERNIQLEQEIAERKRAEKALHKHQQRLVLQNEELKKLSKAIEQSPHIVVITDLTGKIEYANPKFEEITGYTIEEVLYQNPRILKSGEHSEAYYRNLWQTILSGQEWRGEFHNRRKDGTLYWEQASIAPVYDAAGQMTHFVAVKEDITSRKQMEGALDKLLELSRVLATARDLEAALDQAVHWTIEIVPAADEGTLQWLDPDSRVLHTVAFSYAQDVKPEVMPLKPGVGIAGHALVGKQIINVPDVREDERFVPGLRPVHFRSLLVAPLLVRDRALGTLSLNSKQVNAFSLTDAALAGLMADQMAAALDSIELVEKLQKHVIELQARNEELDAFAHTVAHDLRNPVHIIANYAALLEADHTTLGGPILEQMTRTIGRNSRKIGTIINELLLLSSVRKMEEVELAPLEMATLVANALERLGDLIRSHQAEILVPDGWPLALGRGPWVEEIWVNCLSNAVKYGGRPPRVEMGAEPLPGGSMVRFWVRDNGDGLSPEEQERLFTPFERLHQERAEGYGLGLSIVQRIVTKLGGDVGVESTGLHGEGSTFYFTLQGSELPEV